MTATEISVYLQHLQNSRGLTQQAWADASGVPAYTISRYLSASVDAPPFSAITALVKAAGGSLDEMAGIAAPEKETPQHARDMIAQKERSIVYLKEQVSKQEESVQKEREEAAKERATAERIRKTSSRKTVAISVMLFLLGALLMWDLMDPKYGFLYRVFCLQHELSKALLLRG